jgi:hypothetical protein
MTGAEAGRRRRDNDHSNQMRSCRVEGKGNGSIWRGILRDISRWDRPTHIDIPIWLPKETPEEDIIVKAHAVLHDLTSRIADQTARWKQQRRPTRAICQDGVASPITIKQASSTAAGSSQAAHPRRSPADRRQHRQAAGAAAAGRGRRAVEGSAPLADARARVRFVWHGP